MWPFRRRDTDFSREIQAHIDLETDRLVEEGLDPAEALHAARRRFGNVVHHQERYYGSVRWMWLDHLVRDVRYGVRSLRRDKGLVTFATLIVGLGVGATATVFSVAHTLFMRPLPFRDADQLVWISNGDRDYWEADGELSELSVQVFHLLDLQNDSRQFADVAGYHQFDRLGDHLLTGAGQPERLTRLRVTGNFFPLLGVQPQLGRLFSPEEVRFGGPPAIVLTHGVWTRRFGSDSTVVGRSITIDGEPTAVVGVLPRAFDFGSVFDPGRAVDYVAPFPLSAETNEEGNSLALVGRLAPGATVQSAQAEAIALAQRETATPRNAFVPRLVALREHVSGRFRRPVYLLVGAVVLVMLIVCANLSNLLLARGAVREKEMAVRAALGALPRRLVRQMLTESVVLATMGAALGLVLAVIGINAVSQMGATMPLFSSIRLNGAAVGFALGTAVVTGLVFGVAPALRLSGLALHETLKESTRSTSASGRHRMVRGTLVVSEVALACVLLVGAGLLLRSFFKLTDVDLGFQPRSSVTMRIDPNVGFAAAALRTAHYDEALRRVRAAPGVEAAGLTDVLPMAFNRRWCIRGTRPCRDAYVRVVSDGYVSAMGLSLERGRDFSPLDNRAGRPVIIVNRALADREWPGDDPLGRTLRFSRTDWEVVGVVGGMRHLDPERRPGPEVFFPIRQQGDYDRVHLIARGTVGRPALTTALAAALTPLDPTLPVQEVRAIQDIVDTAISPRRFTALLLGGFAGLALVLASLGIYGVVSNSVSQRTQEIGIRIALGAPTTGLRRQILVETMRLAGGGLAVGFVIAVLLARVMQGLLFEITASDPVTFLGVPAILAAVALAAGYLPARRASAVDPMVALNPQSSRG